MMTQGSVDKGRHPVPFLLFLAVQNSSIGDPVTHSVTQSLTQGTFTFDITE